MQPPIAHAADWISTGLLLAPVLAFLGWLAVTQLRERRRSRNGPEPPVDEPG